MWRGNAHSRNAYCVAHNTRDRVYSKRQEPEKNVNKAAVKNITIGEATTVSSAQRSFTILTFTNCPNVGKTAYVT